MAEDEEAGRWGAYLPLLPFQVDGEKYYYVVQDAIPIHDVH